MQKIKIRLPASVVNLGPGLNSLGLALSLYTTIEISARNDEVLNVETVGEGAGRYATGLRHPVVLALARVFQRLERAPFGISIRVENSIPVNCGLGAETAFLLAGVIGANNLMGNVYTRDQTLEIAAHISRADSAVSAMLGGLSTSIMDDEKLYYRTLPSAPLRVVILVPELEKYTRPTPPERVPFVGASHNLSRLPLFMDAFRTGDLKLLGLTLPDQLQLPRLIPQITNYAYVVDVVKDAGAVGVTVAGEGPALLVFGDDKKLDKVAVAGVKAFNNVGVKARSWVVPVDTQGVIISVMGR
ncbi:MAG: homoserine kinase [Armatimonadetes bacterium]|nr:homoserine kinase [Anaerolineae bacterium]